MRVPVNYAPRDYQQVALTALDNGITLAVWCWSRRGGKDKTAFAYGVKKMVERPMNVVLVFPTKEQGKNSFWENVENDGFKTIDAIPEALIERKDNSNMRIVLKNGSTFQVLGATDPDALRGANGKFVHLFGVRGHTRCGARRYPADRGCQRRPSYHSVHPQDRRHLRRHVQNPVRPRP
jgi:hypothetical protein